MTIFERADALIERIAKIYEGYMDSVVLMIIDPDVGSEMSDELAAEAARLQYNFEKLNELYELDLFEFVEKYGDFGEKENIDILMDLLLAEISW